MIEALLIVIAICQIALVTRSYRKEGQDAKVIKFRNIK